jgi:hypothetical protein
MNKHTPGPWRNCAAGSNFQKGKLFIRPVNSEKLIATIASELRYDEKAANARLITAAPEMYEFANGVMKVLGSAEWSTPQHAEQILCELIDRWYAMGSNITKATGESLCTK